MGQEYSLNVEGKAFLLRPDIPEEGINRQPRPGESVDQLSEPLRSYAEQSGLVMRRSALTPYTMFALEATEYAQQQGKFDVFHHATYEAYWTDGKDLGDMDVIREITLKCGLDWSELSERLESGFYRDTVMAQHRQAVDLGISAVPAFLIGNLLFTGAQPYEIFQLAMARARDALQDRGS